MTMNDDKFWIVVSGGPVKPVQKVMALGGRPWDIEWSISPDVSSNIDGFNITIGKYVRTTGEQPSQNRKIEEFWRVSGIPGSVRNIRYGTAIPEATATTARPLENAIYVVKITAISSITEGLRMETGAGVAVIKLSLGSDTETTESRSSAAKESEQKKPAGERPVLITNDILMNLLDLSEDEPRKES
jgi:hypothetical protein